MHNYLKIKQIIKIDFPASILIFSKKFWRPIYFRIKKTIQLLSCFPHNSQMEIWKIIKKGMQNYLRIKQIKKINFQASISIFSKKFRRLIYFRIKKIIQLLSCFPHNSQMETWKIIKKGMQNYLRIKQIIKIDFPASILIFSKKFRRLIYFRIKKTIQLLSCFLYNSQMGTWKIIKKGMQSYLRIKQIIKINFQASISIFSKNFWRLIYFRIKKTM